MWMKRFRKWLFNRLAGLSLLMSILTAIYWIHSFSGDSLSYFNRPQFFSFESNRGLLFISCGYNLSPHDHPPGGWQNNLWPFKLKSYGYRFNPWRGTLLGFDIRIWRVSFYKWGKGLNLTLPYWFLMIGFSWLPTIALIRLIRFRRIENRIAAGLCPACGYNLCATPDRCPECGMAMKTSV
jgi:hypothetical protein